MDVELLDKLKRRNYCEECCLSCRYSRDYIVNGVRFKHCCRRCPSIQGFPIVLNEYYCGEYEVVEDTVVEDTEDTDE